MYYAALVPLFLLATFVVSTPVFAQEAASAEAPAPAATPAPATEGSRASGLDMGLDAISDILKLSDEDPRAIAARLINVALGFLGILTLLMIVWGGIQFMLSGGQEERTARAGATIKSAIIGLIIILSSWAAVQYILEQFVAVTTS